jgi:catechol 2,3-dioxygenase-like lactoylglutathione lyase family enzyme
VSDIAAAARFYRAALAPLGIAPIDCISRSFGACRLDDQDLGGVGFGIDYPVFWIDVFHPHGTRQHTAFRATSREQVVAFHHEAVAAGGTDNGGPGLRMGGYPPGYFAAFVLDPDGNNIEAVYREPAG